jgi:hypothetical protein
MKFCKCAPVVFPSLPADPRFPFRKQNATIVIESGTATASLRDPDPVSNRRRPGTGAAGKSVERAQWHAGGLAQRERNRARQIEPASGEIEPEQISADGVFP